MDVRDDIADWKRMMADRAEAAEARARQAETERDRAIRRLLEANEEIERLIRRCHCQ